VIPRLISVVLSFSAFLRADETQVLVYGATPAGIAAAIAAAKDGERVLLVEPTDQIGGLVTSGLSHTDFRTFEGLTGAYLAFAKRVEQYYRETYGADSPQVRASWRGTFAEPKVNLEIFEKMLAEQAENHGVEVAPAVQCSKLGRGRFTRDRMAAFLDNQDRTTSVSA
jgi:flavin-dependent dehydrogenase